MNPYQIYRNIDGRRGSCYMEFLPGVFKGQCWNAESLFFDFDGEGFYIVQTIIAFHVPSYDLYDNTAIDSHRCWDIVRDLEKLIDLLASDVAPSELQRIPALGRRETFFADVENNRPALLAMLTELVAWLRKTLDGYGSITIVGM